MTMRLTFLGAARMVTGSSYLLEAGNKKFLIDCGMFQGSKAITALNRRPFLYDPSSIDGVLLTHAHIDHGGLLPKLCKSGFKGTIYATKVTTELCSIMLPDSGHIQEFDAEIINRKGQRRGKQHVEPLYTVEDAYDCLKYFSPVEYEESVVVSPEITVRFKDAGHILGSSMLEIWVTENNKTTKFLFSGDLGQPNQPLINDPSVVEAADFVITESTYGNRWHEQYDKEAKLAEIVNDTVARGGNVIIPSFAVGRTQAILYHLHKLFKSNRIPDVPVIIDSPLAIAATNIFMKNTQYFDLEAHEILEKEHESPLNMPQLMFTKTADESKKLNDLEKPAIIISASGMADAGRILHHLKHNLWRAESSVVFVGYQAQGSLGRRLTEGAKRVKVMGEEVSVKAKVYNLDGFSAHADQAQLLSWLGSLKEKPAKVFLLHGEIDMSEPLASIIKERLSFETYIPQYGDTAVISGREVAIEESQVELMDPALKRLRDYLDQFERDYTEYRKRMETLIAADNKKIDDVLRRMEKVYAYIKKTLNDI